jgi:hypothetical protein
MKLRRRMGWLGWVLAGVLAVSAGGAALAATAGSAQPTTTQSADKADKADMADMADKAGRRAGWRHGLARRALHGEVTVQTKEGRRTLVVARGKVTALDADGVTITSVDNVVTAFRINADTRFGFRNEPDPRAELKVGDQAVVIGEKSGDANVARRVVTAKDLPSKGGATP